MSFVSVCKFYSYNRNCKFGNNCQYLHSDISQRPPPYNAEEISDEAVKENRGQSYQASPGNFVQTNTNRINHEDSLNLSHPTHFRTVRSDCGNPATKRSDYDASQGVISHAASVTDSDKKDAATTQSRNVCRFFKQHGYCNFDRNCRFVHTSDSGGRFAPTANKPRFSQNERKQVPPRFQNRERTSSSKIAVDDLHLNDSKDVESDPHVEHGNSGNEPCIPALDSAVRDTRNATRGNGKLCKYFKSGYCNRGKRCMFLHQYGDKKDKNGEGRTKKAPQGQDEDGHTAEGDVKSQSLANGGNSHARPTYQRPVRPTYQRPVRPTYQRPVRPTNVLPQVVTLSELQMNGTEKYRQYDVNYLKKRFQAVTLEVEGDDEVEDSAKLEIESNGPTLELVFSPSDPDWPFDVKTYILHLTLPANYPEQVMSVAVPSDKQDLPDTVRRYLEISMNEWIIDRQVDLTKNSKSELMVRPFFKWLDRNFEDVMTEALKQLKRELTARAAGFEFIPAAHLKARYAVDEVDDDEDGSTSQEEAGDSLAEDDDQSSDECLDSDDGSDESDEEGEGRRPGLDLGTDRKGTEIQLRHLQLKQNASSLLFERLYLIVQCARCKTQSEVSVGGEKAVALTCEKCSHEMFIQFRPTLVHQFSSVVGYLDLDNCQAFDLIFPDCKFAVSCLSCGKLTKINGMMSGQLTDGWCQACNGRFKFATEAVKFYQLQPSSLDEEKKQQAEVTRPKGKKKPPKDPAIREGEPLPDFGACRHYKQSYRWLRFPCCGKAYPCDVCHDKKEDHEMTMATRMICGHCCKEQNYSASRPCNTCGHHMTKTRSAHWEGGAGCRDRISMSQNDKQKYKNMNKTVSRKKVNSGASSKKKNTKLRHT